MTEDNVRHRKRVSDRSYDFDTNANNNDTDDSFSVFNNHQQKRRQQERTSSNRRKNEGLICSICEGPAHGYNFDAITCESCKAFFRRNALKNDVWKAKERFYLKRIVIVYFLGNV